MLLSLCIATSGALMQPGIKRPFLRSPQISMSESWSTDEDWALQDSAPAFTVGRGNERATFWTALVASTPDLAKRSAAECEKRLRELKEKAEVGSAPLVLDEW